MSVMTEPCGGCGESNPKKACIGCLHFHAPTTREKADHAELAANAHIRNLRLAASRDFAVSGYSDGLIVEQDMRGMLLAAAEAFDAILSEIAALRGDLEASRKEADRLAYGCDDARLAAVEIRATQAERQRDELRKALGDVLHIFPSQKPRASDESEPQAIRTARALLANQGADQ